MNDPLPCARCGATLPADSPEGLCPACLMSGGLGSEAATVGIGDTPKSAPRPFAAPDPQELEAYFPQFEILELLGRGGMGAVYKARQKNLNRLVALKILTIDPGEDGGFAERFQREAQSLARLNHPNIVNIYDFGETNGLYYFLMEYVDGANLRTLIRGGEMKPQAALALVPSICDALQFAHDGGIVHRDIKPENVLVDRSGRVKIADFGLAKLLGHEGDDHHLTRTGMTLGTPRYMAPEQTDQPETVDHRADIYSLGVVFYEMLTGEVPTGRFALPSERVQVDVKLDEIVLRSLERDVSLRYQKMSEVKNDVENASLAFERSPRVSLPKRHLLAALLVALFFLGIFSAFEYEYTNTSTGTTEGHTFTVGMENDPLFHHTVEYGRGGTCDSICSRGPLSRFLSASWPSPP